MPHFHDFNPWAATLTYLNSLDEVKGLIGGDDLSWIEGNGHKKLDPYILRWKNLKEFSLGIRYGKEGSEYYSPHVVNHELAQELWDKYNPHSEVSK